MTMGRNSMGIIKDDTMNVNSVGCSTINVVEDKVIGNPKRFISAFSL
jgi:hypothetical protein